MTLGGEESISRSTGRRRFWVAAAASGLLLVGGTIAYNSYFVGTLSDVAMLEEDERPKVKVIESDQVTFSPESQKPEVQFRLETKTRTVPITRARVETKTRSVSVQKTRTETRQRKQADGSFKTYSVEVPYTEQVQQNYTVNVPYTEQVAQSYQVQVPYTADGKRIEKSEYGKYGLNEQGRRGDELKVGEGKQPSQTTFDSVARPSEGEKLPKSC